MKTKQLSYIFLGILILACSKDRLNPSSKIKNTSNDLKFTRATSGTLDSWKSEPLKKIINSDQDLPVVSKNGIEVYFSIENLRDGLQSVEYPVEVELLEVLTPREMILHRAPTMAGNRVLSSGGALYLKVSKDGIELSIDPKLGYSIKVPVTRLTDPEMDYFKGERGLDGFVDWEEGPEFLKVNCPDGQIGPTDCLGSFDLPTLSLVGDERPEVDRPKGYITYQLFPDEFGWINIDKYTNFDGDTAQISITGKDIAPESLFIFLYLPSTNSIMSIAAGKEFPLPIGIEAKIVAMAFTTEDEIFAGWKEITITEDEEIEITVENISEEDLLAYLDTL